MMFMIINISSVNNIDNNDMFFFFFKKNLLLSLLLLILLSFTLTGTALSASRDSPPSAARRWAGGKDKTLNPKP